MMKNAHPANRFSQFSFWGILLVMLLALYRPAVQGGFTLDADHLIVNNPFIKQPELFSELWRNCFFQFYPGAEEVRINYYRPLVAVTYALDYRIWGLDPMGYRLTNIFFHSLNVLLWFRLMMAVFAHRRLAFWSAVLFCFLPVHEWNINSVSGRTTLLQMMFMFISAGQWVRYDKSGRPASLMLGVLSFGLALLCREMALFLPLGLAALGAVMPGAGRRRCFSIGAYIAVCVAYLLVRSFFLPIVADPAAVDIVGKIRSVLIWPGLMFEYLGHMILPRTAGVIRTLDFTRPYIQITGGLMFAAFLYGLFRLGQKRDERRRIWMFAGLWFLAGFVPALFAIEQFYFLGPVPPENYLYWPAGGLCVALAGGLVLYRRRGTDIFLLVLVGYFAGQLVYQNQFWSHESLLLKHTMAVEGARSRLAKDQYLIKYETDPAPIKVRVMAARSDAEKSNWLMTLGWYYMRARQFDKAREAFEQAHVLEPLAHSLRAIAATYIKQGRLDKALDYVERSLARDPMSAYAYRLKGVALYQLRLYSRCVKSFRQALYYDPDDIVSRTHLGLAYLWTNRTGLFHSTIAEALRRSGNDNWVPLYIGAELYRHRQAELAVRYLEDVAQRFPGNAAIHGQLAKIYANVGLGEQARQHWRAVLKVSPLNAEARRGLRLFTGPSAH